MNALTEEQKQATKERKEKFRLICKQLTAMTDEKRAELSAKCLFTNIKGHVLSLHNQYLIMLQGGTSSTILGGFQQWKKSGRIVKKGEHGYSIWFPSGNRKVMDENNEETEKPGFLVGTVFDVSQTKEINDV